MLGGVSSAATPSFSKHPPFTPTPSNLPLPPLPPPRPPPAIHPYLPCFSHSPIEGTVLRGTTFHHTSSPMPRPHSPAASSQTAQCGAMADTKGLNFSPAALLKEKKLVSIPDRKPPPPQETGSTGRTLERISPRAPGSPPVPFGEDVLAPTTGLCPRSPGGLPEEQERN